MRPIFNIIYIVILNVSVVSVTFARTPTSDKKYSPPDLEDHASYFSKSRERISNADLKRADELRLKSIASIKSMIGKEKNKENRFELLLRLGELHIERHDYLRDIAMDTYAKTWDQWNQNPDKANRGNEPKVNVSSAEMEMQNAATVFRQLVKEFPKHRRSDAAIYALAQVLARLGQDSAVDYYKQLIKLHPRSDLVADSYLSLGEYYFDKHQISDAVDSYKKVLNYKKHRAYPYAVYKLGWAYFNAPQKNPEEAQKNYKKAVSAFKLVVSLSKKSKVKNGGNSNFNLRDEALRDLVMVWAESEDVNSAWVYFRSIGEHESFYNVLERLGNIYADQGKNEKAVLVFQRLLKEAPERSRNPWVHVKLVEIFDTMNNLDEAVDELKALPVLYVGKTKWAAANQKNGSKDVVNQANELVERTLHRFGTMFHQRGQKSKLKNYLESAASIYLTYLDRFPKSTASYDIRYYLAEIQYDFKKFENASKNYLKVAQSNPAGKYHKDAAFNAVSSLHDKIAGEKFEKTPPPGQVPKPLSIPSSKLLLVETIEVYLKMLPAEKESNNMRFEVAYIYFEYGHYPESIKRFSKIIEDYPLTKQAENSTKIVLAYHAKRQDWNKVIDLGNEFNRKKEFAQNKSLMKFIADTVREATFSLASSYEKNSKYELAAKTFVDYQKQFPRDSSADRALYNAMNNYFRIGKTDSAIATANILIDEYPKSSLIGDVLADMASTYESLAKFPEAASVYKRFGTEFSKDKRAPAALYNAAVLYKGLKKYDESINCLAEFSRRFPSSEIASDALLELASLYEQQGDIRNAIGVYNKLVVDYAEKKDQTAFAGTKIAVLKVALGNDKNGAFILENVRQKLLKENTASAVKAREVLASALFKLAENDFSNFLKFKITDNSNLEKNISEKQALLVRLSDNYDKIVDLGSGEFMVASLYRLGEAHENFAQNLLRTSAPAGLAQGDKDKFKTELERLAFPLRDQAYKFFEAALKRSAEVETFTEWTRRAYKKMAELAPDKVRVVDDIAADPAYLSHVIQQDSQSIVRLIESSMGGE